MKAVNNLSSEEYLKRELEKLRAVYQNLFEENPLAMLVTDITTSRIIGVNKAALDKYGYAEDEFVTLTIDDLVNGPNEIDNPAETASYTCHYKKWGEVLYIEDKRSEIVYKNVKAQLIIINDVTAKVLAEEKEKKAKQRLDAIFRGTHDAILLADDSGRYAQVNEAACLMLGYSEDELLSLSVADIIKDVTENSYDDLWRRFLNAGTQTGIIELKKKNGDIIICHYNANSNVLPGLHLSILTDITEREIARRKIEQQAKYIDSIIESITDCFFVVDNNWIVKYWNKAAERVLQNPREQVLGHSLWDVYKSEIGGGFYKAYHKAFESGLPVHFEEYFAGSDIWLDVSAYPSSDRLTVYFRDITDKKKQALEMLQAKKNQSALINSTTDLIWSVNNELKLVTFNTAYSDLVENATGKPAFEGLQLPAKFNDKEKDEKWKKLYRRALQGEAFSIEETVTDINTGETRLAEIDFNPIYGVNINNVIGVACHSHDITERVKAQWLIEEQNKKLQSNKEDLQKLANKIEKLMNSSLDIICSVDEDGRFVQVNEASNHVLGYKPEELIGKHVLDFIDPASLQLTIDVGASLVKGNDLPGFENIYFHKSGKRVHLNWSARWDADEGLVFAVARDTTSQQEAEKLKAVAEQRFTALVEKGADMVGIIDTDGNYKFASPNVEQVLGYKPELLVGKNALILIHPDDLHLANIELEKVIKGGEVKLAAFRFQNAKGEWRWLETIATNQLSNPAINGIVINSRDITIRKEIEDEREQMIKELLKTNADLKQFSFITSHNLRAPLSNITGILNIIDYPGLDNYNRQMIEMLDVSAKQLQKTIDDLSKILVIKNNTNIEISAIDLTEAVDEVKGIFISTRNDVYAEIITDFKVQEIGFNKTYLQSILVNLLSNAIKYQSPKRNLMINISTDVDENGNVIFKFSDNGSGIDLGLHKNKVFGLYQRFHNNKEGQGLGLFIIKSQIVALGGKIDVESEPGNGTTFTITLKNQPFTSKQEENREINSPVTQIQASFGL